MKSTVRAIPKIILLVALAALARPAIATITYTSCSSGCSSSSGTYAVWQTAPGSAGLTFSMSAGDALPRGNLASGVYTDPTGTVFTDYNGASIDTLMSVSGTSLLQGIGGTGTGIEIVLPANTYAFAMEITTPVGSGFTNPWIAVGDHNVGGTNYNLVIPSAAEPSSSSRFISNTPLSELFVGPLSSGSRLQINDFELGQVSPTPEASSVGSYRQRIGVIGRPAPPPHPQTRQCRRLKRSAPGSAADQDGSFSTERSAAVLSAPGTSSAV